MTSQGDPHRTLGVRPGASLNEIRSAYRRLVKQYHPDAAGERALPRFLTIRAAYDRLVDGEGRLRPAAGSAEPWRADPGRARASRDAWRARRASAGTRSAGRGEAGDAGDGAGRPGGHTAEPTADQEASRSGGRRPGTGADGRRTGPSRPGDAAGGGRTAPGAAAPGERRRGHVRGPRKATPGSTTYDEAAELPRDPEWEGAGWYGPSLRTYWTLNPREYADPRKHGPEYQARARRAAGSSPGGVEPEGGAPAPEPIAETDDGAPDAAWHWSGEAGTTTDGPEPEWGTRGWSYNASVGGDGGMGPRAAEAGDAVRDRWSGSGGRHAGPAVPASAPFPDIEALARRLGPASLRALALAPDRRWRWLLALIAWPALGYAAGTLISMLTGCGSFAASCPEPLPLLPLAAQPVVLAALLALPTAVAGAAFAALLALAVSLPVATVLAIGGGVDPGPSRLVLAVTVAAAYVLGLAWAAFVLGRRPAP